MSQGTGKGKRTILWVVVVIFVLVAVVCGVYYRAQPVAQEGDTVRGVEFEDRDVTGQVDQSALLAALSQADYRRTLFPQGNFYYQSGEGQVVITLARADGESAQVFLSPQSQSIYTGHITVGDTIYAWEPPILEGEQLYQQVIELVEAGKQ